MGPPLPYGFSVSGSLLDWREATVSKALSNLSIPDGDFLFYPLEPSLQRNIQISLEERDCKSDVNDLCSRKSLVYDPIGYLLLLEMLWRCKPGNEQETPIVQQPEIAGFHQRPASSGFRMSRNSFPAQPPVLMTSNDWLGAVRCMITHTPESADRAAQLINEITMAPSSGSLWQSIIVSAYCLNYIETSERRSIGIDFIRELVPMASSGDDYCLSFIMLVYILVSTTASEEDFVQESSLLSEILVSMVQEPTKPYVKVNRRMGKQPGLALRLGIDPIRQRSTSSKPVRPMTADPVPSQWSKEILRKSSTTESHQWTKDNSLWSQLFGVDESNKLAWLLTRFIKSQNLINRLGDLESILDLGNHPDSNLLINTWADLMRNLACHMCAPESGYALHNALIYKYYSEFCAVLGDNEDPMNLPLWRSTEVQNTYCAALHGLFENEAPPYPVLSEAGAVAVYYVYNCLCLVIKRSSDPAFRISKKMRTHIDSLLSIFIKHNADRIKPIMNIHIRRSCSSKVQQKIWKDFYISIPANQPSRRNDGVQTARYHDFRKIIKGAKNPWDLLFILNYSRRNQILLAVTLKQLVAWYKNTESQCYLALAVLITEVCAVTCTMDFIGEQIALFHQIVDTDPVYKKFAASWLSLISQSSVINPYIYVSVLEGCVVEPRQSTEARSLFFCVLAQIRSYAPAPDCLHEMFTEALLNLRVTNNPIVFWIETFHRHRAENRLLAISLPILLTSTLDSFDPDFMRSLRDAARNAAVQAIVQDWISTIISGVNVPILLEALNFQPILDIIVHPLCEPVLGMVTNLIEHTLEFIIPDCNRSECQCENLDFHSVVLNRLESAIGILCSSLEDSNRHRALGRIRAKLLAPRNITPIPRGPDLDFRMKRYFMDPGIYSVLSPSVIRFCEKTDIQRLRLLGSSVMGSWPQDLLRSDELVAVAAWVFEMHVQNLELDHGEAQYPLNDNGSIPIDEYWYKLIEQNGTRVQVRTARNKVLRKLREWVLSIVTTTHESKKDRERDFVSMVIKKFRISDLLISGKMIDCRKTFIRTPLFWESSLGNDTFAKLWIRAPGNDNIDWLSLPRIPITENLPMMLKLMGLPNDCRLLVPELLMMALVARDLGTTPIHEVRLFLPQIVQAIRGDQFRILETQLFDLATKNPRMTTSIYCEVSKEMGNPKYRDVFRRLSCTLETWIAGHESCRDIYFIMDMISLSHRAISHLDDRTAFVRHEISEICRNYSMSIVADLQEAAGLQARFYDPFDENFRIISVCDLSRCRVLKSAAKAPFVVEFAALDVRDRQLCIRGIIFKMNDDLRSDQLALQFMNVFQKISIGKLPLWLKPYGVQCCFVFNCFGGVIELVPKSRSRHEIGKNLGMSLNQFYYTSLGQSARWNFLRSLAAYSILSFILQIKDRHNANMLITDDGYLLHIDFGFIMDLSPGGDIKFERAPFKLTQDMVDLVNGTTATAGISDCGFSLLKELIVDGYMRLRQDADFYKTLILFYGDLNCFKRRTIKNFMRRLKPDVNDKRARDFMASQVDSAVNAFSTRIYDRVQAIQQGISYK